MSEWVQVDPITVNKEIQTNIRGVTVKVSTSPYDIPVKVRGYREPNSNFFVIELQYIMPSEPTREVRPSPGQPVILEVGTKSERIYKIKVDVVQLKAEAVGFELFNQEVEQDITGVISTFSSQGNRIQGRYAATGQAIRSNRDALLGSLH